MERRRVNLVGPTLLIGIGAIMLLNNLEVLDWTLWDVARLWPILLIGAGLEVLIGRQSIWGSLAAAVIVVGLIGGSIWLADTGSLRPVGGEVVEINYELTDGDSAGIILEPAVSNIKVGALVDSTDLLSGTIQVVSNEELQRSVRTDDRMEVTLSSQPRNPYGYLGIDGRSRWQLGINASTAVDLELDLGIGDAEINLSDLAIDSARFDFGLGRIVTSLPQDNDAAVVVDGGIGIVIIQVPSDVGVRISLDAGLVGRALPSNYLQDGDTYTSSNYSKADSRVDVTVSLGIGSIRIQEFSGD